MSNLVTKVFFYSAQLLFLLLFISALSEAGAQQADSEPLADQLTDLLKHEYFQVGVLLQSQGRFSFEDDQFNGGRKYDLGATRLDMRGRLDQGFTYRLQLDFRRQTSVIDAQVGYQFSQKFRLVAGAFKPFLSLDLDPGPGDTDFINRARQVGVMMNSREIGLTALGDVGNFNYRVGMYNGTGLTRQNDNRFMYTKRLGYTIPLDESGARVRLGTNLALNQTRFVPVGNTGLESTGDRWIYGAYIDFDTAGLFGAFEFLQTDFESAGINEDVTITGFYGTLGYKINPKNEVLGRVDFIGYNLDDMSDTYLLSFGWNHQFTRLFSFALNALIEFNEDDDTRSGLSGQFQFQF